MTAVIGTEGRGVMTIEIAGAASAAAAGLGAIANPEGVNILVLRATLVVLAPSTGAANLSAGIAATAALADTDILNALAVNGVAANTCYNGHAMQNTGQTAITVPTLWAPSAYLTFTGSATTVGLVAKLFLEYIRVN